MKITIKDLEKKGACLGGGEWFIENFGEDGEVDIEDLKSKLIEQKKYKHLEWLYENFKLSGEYIEHYNNGGIKIICYYKDGELDGEYIKYSYYCDIKLKYYYKNGELDGEYVEFYDNKTVYKRCFYNKGKLNGEYVKYRYFGGILGKCCYKNGVKIK